MDQLPPLARPLSLLLDSSWELLLQICPQTLTDQNRVMIHPLIPCMLCLGFHGHLLHNIDAILLPPDPKVEADEKKKKKKWMVMEQYKWWLQMALYSLLVLGGQSVGTLLGRLYYDKGGNSRWMATFVQVAGFPILLPFQLLTSSPRKMEDSSHLLWILASIYLSLGIFLAADCMLYSIGLQYLPVTTYTLICASQLGFNALFSFFLNGQKLTPYIINSLVLLTISATLLVFQPDDSDGSHGKPKSKYVIGFLSTLGASAGYGLMLSVTQLAFQKIIRQETIRAVLDMSIYQSVVATFVILIGLFASGDWRRLSGEMGGYRAGKVSYVMNLVWTAVSWQVFNVGCVGLIFKISSLFSNVISVLGLPLAPILAVVCLNDNLTGLKGVSMVLAIWGFVSYIYQHYVDDLKMKKGIAAQSSVTTTNG